MRAVKSFLVFLGVILLCAASMQAQTNGAEAASAGSANEDNNQYLIGYQDVLEIRVLKHEELNQKITVGRTGSIFVPRIDQPVSVICKTGQQVAEEIMTAYKKDFLRDPFVSVEVIEQKSQGVSVIGAVEHPGSIYLTRKTMLLDLLAKAGGPNSRAGTRVVVARPGSTSSCKQDPNDVADDDVKLIEFKLKDVKEGKENFWMQPGDVVSVLDADIVYVYGNVKRQGAYELREPITLTMALAKAEGIKSATQQDKIRILRQKDGSFEREELVYDLKAIAAGKVNDPMIEPSDIVAVSEDKAKFILNTIARAATGGLPALVYRLPVP